MRVIIIGGGAAGMAAAYGAAKAGQCVTLLEKNEKLGKKVYITGKGRCNVTNACPPEELPNAFFSNPRFLYSAFRHFSNGDLIGFLEDHGCPVKTERGDRVFPVSDHASDVIRAFERSLRELGVKILFGTEMQSFEVQEGLLTGVRVRENGKTRTVPGDAFVLTTGGRSYPSTGSTGDGYRLLRAIGHTIVSTFPALVPLETAESWPKSLSGLTLKNVRLTVFRGEKALVSEFGELMFTHFGISGPVVLTASSEITGVLGAGEQLEARIDLKPALSEETLEARLVREFSSGGGKLLKTVMTSLVPSSLVPPVLSEAGVDGEKQVSGIRKEERKALLRALKGLKLTLTATRGFEEAIVTKGGLSVKEVRPSTMQSRLMPNLFVAGEVLDVDGKTGGFNLQAAWSTGMLAGESSAKYLEEISME